jgi:hypothetical protein
MTKECLICNRTPITHAVIFNSGFNSHNDQAITYAYLCKLHGYMFSTKLAKESLANDGAKLICLNTIWHKLGIK